MEGLFGDGLVDALCCGGDSLEEDLRWGPRLGALVDLVEFVDGKPKYFPNIFDDSDSPINSLSDDI